MGNPVGIASIFGPILVIMGIWGLLYQDNVKKVAESVKKNPSILYLGGVVNLIVGLTIIHISPEWSLNIGVLVTILGWLLFIRGLIVFFLPNIILKMVKAQTNAYVFFGLISTVWGLALCWMAYI